MKAQSLENQLRNAVPPAPDMEARLRARRAALAEFARVHAEQGTAVPASEAVHRDGETGGAIPAHGGQTAGTSPERGGPSAGRARKKESLWPLSWPLKNAWLGGMATACVVVVGVSVVYLMPAKDREIQLSRTLTTSGPVAPEATSAQPSTPVESEVAPPQATTQPAEARGDAASQIEPVAPVLGELSGASASTSASASTPSSDKRQTNASSRAELPRATGVPLPETTDMPSPSAGPRREAIGGIRAGQPGAGEKDLNDAGEVTVTGSRVRRRFH